MHMQYPPWHGADLTQEIQRQAAWKEDEPAWQGAGVGRAGRGASMQMGVGLGHIPGISRVTLNYWAWGMDAAHFVQGGVHRRQLADCIQGHVAFGTAQLVASLTQGAFASTRLEASLVAYSLHPSHGMGRSSLPSWKWR